MAVPFTFPEENNDVEVIIRQLSLLLNRLAVEFKKQRIENIQLRARNKQQRAASHQKNPTSVGDTLLNAITTNTKHFAITTDSNFSTNENYEKNELCRTDSTTDLTEEDEEEQQLQQQQQQTVQETSLRRFFGERLQQSQRGVWWSWFAPSALTRNSFWTTAVICVVGWHLLR